MTSLDDLNQRRGAVADGEWQRYDFGASKVEDVDGWQYTSPGHEMTRVVYFENAEDPSADSAKGYFTVVFDGNDSAEVKEAYAIINGNIFGARVAEEPAEGTAPRSR